MEEDQKELKGWWLRLEVTILHRVRAPSRGLLGMEASPPTAAADGFFFSNFFYYCFASITYADR